MTNDEAKAIGLRAVACDGWRWLPGMLTNGGGRLLRVCSFDAKFVVAHYPHSTLSPFPSTGLTPDFRDAATLGCLLVLVREDFAATWHALDGVDASLPQLKPKWAGVRRAGWDVVADGGFLGGTLGSGDTEAEALVAALEAASARVQP